MKIAVRTPSGIAPAKGTRSLPDNFAQTAINCNLGSDEWRPWNSPGASVATLANNNGLTMYRFGQDVVGDATYWFSFATRRDLARVPVAGDAAEKTIITGGSYPEITDSSIAVASSPYPADTYRLGIGTPDTAISTATVGGTATPNTTAEDRYYIYTFVSSWGEESAPSPAKGPASTKPGETVSLSGIPVAPAAGFTDRGNITLKRIYRSNTGSTSTEYQYVTELAIATTTYVDSIADGDLGEICPTLDWTEPTDTMHSVVGLTNGMLGALDGNEACICEPFRPHAWPEKYRTALEFKPIGCGSFGGYWVICTNGDPYIGFATSPEAYVFERLRVAQACVSKPSIASTGDGVLYASPDGIVAVSQGAAPVITEKFMNRTEWQKLNPSSIIGAFTEGRYHGWYSGASAPYSSYTGFILDLKAGSLTFTDITASAVFVDPGKDAMYLQQGTSVVRWDAGSAASLTWKSKKFESPKPINFGAAQIIITSGTLALKVYADGTLVATVAAIASAAPFRLPSGFKARAWEFELTGTGQAEAVLIAETMRELGDV